MKSTSGAHFVALDHIRAIAALLVFVWHFIHGDDGYPVSFKETPIWGPLVLFDQGHVGVALFMTLSGYLFAKLLDGKKVIFHLFLWNRFLRLFPLLLLVFVIDAILDVGFVRAAKALPWYLWNLRFGLVLPSWPNGGWSITTELHFYLLLPLVLFLRRRFTLGWLVLLAIGLRVCLYYRNGEIQDLAYWTIVGRIDQFVLGVMAFHAAQRFKDRHMLAASIFAALFTVYYYFDKAGGFYLMGGYPSPSPIWIGMATVEGLAFAGLIAWYDSSYSNAEGRVSRALGKIGEYSYSIYLLHFFFVFQASDWIHRNIIDLSNFYVAFPVAVVAFLFMIPIAYLSMRFIEAPPMRLRKSYYRPVESNFRAKNEDAPAV